MGVAGRVGVRRGMGRRRDELGVLGVALGPAVEQVERDNRRRVAAAARALKHNPEDRAEIAAIQQDWPRCVSGTGSSQ